MREFLRKYFHDHYYKTINLPRHEIFKMRMIEVFSFVQLCSC